METLITRSETAKHLGISLRGVDRLLAEGALPHIYIGKRVLVLERDLAQFIKRRRVVRS